ncbi:ANTAR domain-containing protein [Streptomyces collinus]|uniref:ANTAR domain-containing protein n=1 Tax=Streptomyces collinus TaxID=42684 RepID=UPI0036943CF5
MTTSRAPRPLPNRDAALGHLQQENARLRQAIGSRATVDQAIGVLIAIHRIPPTAGCEVLREVSQRTTPSCTRSPKR